MRNSIDKKYTDLQQDIIDNGVSKGDRTGTGTISVFGRQLRHDMSEGFPLLTTKKMAWKSMVVELLWFLRGETNIKWLVDRGCNIWNGDAYKRYASEMERGKHGAWFDKKRFIEEIKTNDTFAEQWGDLGPIYGKQWRNWLYYSEGLKFSDTDIDYHVESVDGEDGYGELRVVDQIKNSIELLKIDPDSRRNIVSAWNVGDLDKMTLPPCHNFFQFWTRDLTYDEFTNYYSHELWQDIACYCPKGKSFNQYAQEGGFKTKGISLMWNQRSVDTFLGLPFNIASYALLLEIIAKEVNMVPLEIIGNLGDTHLYNNHIDQAKEQIGRVGFELPKVNIKPFETIEELTLDHFELIGYKSHPRIKAPLSN